MSKFLLLVVADCADKVSDKETLLYDRHNSAVAVATAKAILPCIK